MSVNNEGMNRYGSLIHILFSHNVQLVLQKGGGCPSVRDLEERRVRTTWLWKSYNI